MIREEWQSDDGAIRLILGDALEVLPGLSGIDCVVTDPPYGISFVQRTTGATIYGDDQKPDVSPLLQLSVPSVIWGANYFVSPTPGRLIWLKRAVDQAATKSYADAEIAFVSTIESVKVHRQISDGCIRQGEEHGIVRLHPFQKPVALMRWCLQFASGETVFDPYMGSGTTGVACIRLSRRFIGIEINPEYYAIAKRRCIEELNRYPLLEAPKAKQRSLLETEA